MTSILLIEDDPDLAEGLQHLLRGEGYDVEHRADGPGGLAAASDGSHQLLIVDVMLPGLDGFGILERLRKRGMQTPVIFLTAKDQEHDVVRGLEGGAADYVTKPFRIRELLARIRSVLRRGRPLAAHGIGSLVFDPEAQTLSGPGEVCTLSHHEAALLAYLLERAGEPVARDELLAGCWGDAPVTRRVVDFHITQLRRKLAAAGGHSEPRHLLTVYGHGYKLAP